GGEEGGRGAEGGGRRDGGEVRRGEVRHRPRKGDEGGTVRRGPRGYQGGVAGEGIEVAGGEEGGPREGQEGVAVATVHPDEGGGRVAGVRLRGEPPPGPGHARTHRRQLHHDREGGGGGARPHGARRGWVRLRVRDRVRLGGDDAAAAGGRPAGQRPV